jgi:hypothetical protein
VKGIDGLDVERARDDTLDRFVRKSLMIQTVLLPQLLVSGSAIGAVYNVRRDHRHEGRFENANAMVPVPLPIVFPASDHYGQQGNLPTR